MEHLLQKIAEYLAKESELIVIAPHARDAARDSQVIRPPFGGHPLFMMFALYKGLALAIRGRVRLFFGGSLLVAPLIRLLAILTRRPGGVYAHGLDVIYPSRIYQALQRSTTPGLDGVICNSSNTRMLLEKRFRPSGKVMVIPPGIEFPQSPPSQEAAPFSFPYLLSVGRLTDRKGLLEFVERSLPPLVAEYPELRLVIAGDDPVDAMVHREGYRRKLERLISEIGLQDSVHLLGRVSEAQKALLYRHAQAMIFPLIPVSGDVEGFGIVAVEAAIHGCPTIAFNEGGVADAVIPGRTGELVPSGDYTAMSETIRDVLRQKAGYPDTASIAASRFDWKVLVPEYQSFLDAVAFGDRRHR